MPTLIAHTHTYSYTSELMYFNMFAELQVKNKLILMHVHACGWVYSMTCSNYFRSLKPCRPAGVSVFTNCAAKHCLNPQNFNSFQSGVFQRCQMCHAEFLGNFLNNDAQNALNIIIWWKGAALNHVVWYFQMVQNKTVFKKGGKLYANELKKEKEQEGYKAFVPICPPLATYFFKAVPCYTCVNRILRASVN